jgi:hypothetical protein
VAQKHVWFFALLLAVLMVGCGGSEYRFGNSQSSTPSNLSGQWTFTASSTTTSAKYNGTGSVQQTNTAIFGSINLLFDFCAPTASITGMVGSTAPTEPGIPSSSTAIAMFLQENVSLGGSQTATLYGTVTIDGKRMSGTYDLAPGACSLYGESGVWAANKN